MKQKVLSSLLLSSFLTLSSCGSMMSMLDEAQNAEQDSAVLEKIANSCKDYDRNALALEKLSPEKRSVTLIDRASRDLSNCRERIESELQPFYNSAGDLVTALSNPDKSKVDLGGKSISVKAIYQNTLKLEKKLMSLPLDLCMQKTGQFRSEGFGGNWEPLVLSMTDWKGAECKLSSKDAYLTPSLSNADKSHLKNVCAGSIIQASDFKLEMLQVNLAKKTSLVWCQKSKERKAASAFLSSPKVDERCEPCKLWAKNNK